MVHIIFVSFQTPTQEEPNLNTRENGPQQRQDEMPSTFDDGQQQGKVGDDDLLEVGL